MRAYLVTCGLDPGRASMRSMLSALAVAWPGDPGMPRAVRHTWIGLSGAAHHHAFELAPTLTEVRHLVDEVASINGVLQGSTDRARSAHS